MAEEVAPHLKLLDYPVGQAEVAAEAMVVSMQEDLELLVKDLPVQVVMLAEVPAEVLVVAEVRQPQVLLEPPEVLAMVAQVAPAPHQVFPAQA